MSKGGEKQQVSNDPWAYLQPYLTGMPGGSGKNKIPARTGLMPEAERLYNNGPGFFTPFDPAQIAGQEARLGFAQNFPTLQKPYQDATQFGLFGGFNPENNPYAPQGLTGAVGGGLNALGSGNPYQGGMLGATLGGPSANSNPFGIGGAVRSSLAGPSTGSNPFGINNAIQFGLNAPNIKNNPYLGQYMDAATRPLTQQLEMGQLPSIRSQAADAGQQGSSRQGVAEGVARGLTNQAIGDTRAQIANQAYGQGLGAQANAINAAQQSYGQDIQRQLAGVGLAQQSYGQDINRQLAGLGLANQSYGQDIARQQGAMNFAGNAGSQAFDQQARALALYPQMMQSGLLPSSLLSQVGAERQASANQQQTDPYARLQQYAGILGGLTGAGGTSVQSGGGSNAAMGALGGGLGGAGLANMLGLSGPWGWGLAGLGGLLGAFS